MKLEIKNLIQDGIQVVESSPVTPVPTVVNDTVADLQQLMDKTGKSLHIVIMGAVKAGKSSLLNALAKEEVSPVGVTETTATIMRILYGAEKGAEIVMSNQSPISGSIEQILNTLKTRKGDKDFFEHCKEVCIYLPENSLQNVEIVDTPGLNTLTASNQQRSLDYIQQADVILWLLHGQYLGQSDVEDEIEKIHNMGKKMLCVVSRADQLDDDEREEVLQYVTRKYGDFFEKIFLFSGNEAMKAALQQNEAGMSSSGLNDIRNYIKANYVQQADNVHVESLLDSLQATVKKDIYYHEDLLDKQKEKYKNYQKMVEELEQQSMEIQQDFRQDFRRWVDIRLLSDATQRLNHEIDKTSIGLKTNLRQQIEPVWKDVFSQTRIENELKDYAEKQSERLTSMWESVLSKLAQRYDFRLTAKANSLSMTGQVGDLDIDDSSVGNAIAKGTIWGAIGGVGASAYAAGLGTYAAHLSMAGALGSFMLPALAIGAAAGFAKKYYDFNEDKKKLKLQAKDMLIETKTQIKHLLQDDYEHRIASICQAICEKAQELVLKRNFNVSTPEEFNNCEQELTMHIKNLRRYLNDAPSYQSVTNELRQEIASVRQSMEAKTQEYLQNLKLDDTDGWSADDVKRKIQQMRVELEAEKQRQIDALTKKNGENQQLLEAANRDLELQMQIAVKKLQEKVQLQEEKLHESNVKLKEKDKMLKEQSKELKSLAKVTKEMEAQLQKMEDSNQVVSNQSIHAELMRILKKAKREVDIMSPWISHSIVNNEFKDVVQAMIDRKVTLKIVYGIENSQSRNNKFREQDDKRLHESEKILDELSRLNNARNYIFAKYFSSHVKLVLCDDEEYILTSCNVLSNKGSNWEEVGEISNNKKLLQEYRQRFFDFP